MLIEINLKVFRELLKRCNLKYITNDVDSNMINLEVTQTGQPKSIIPKNQAAPVTTSSSSYEITAHLKSNVRSGDTFTTKGAMGMIQEIIANLKEVELVITIRNKALGYISISRDV